VPSAISTDHGGTVYPVPPSGAKVYANVDGHRIDDGRYTNFKGDLAGIVPSERIYTDPVRVFAYGTDASFYRLLPQMVVKIHDEKEEKHSTPVTFRAAGTSLSGQAVTDSILLKLSHTGKNFRNYEITVRGDDDPSPPPAIRVDETKTPENLMTQRIKYFPRADAFSPSGTPRLRASRPRD
jgi:D-lactate dehydrogenase